MGILDLKVVFDNLGITDDSIKAAVALGYKLAMEDVRDDEEEDRFIEDLKNPTED